MKADRQTPLMLAVDPLDAQAALPAAPPELRGAPDLFPDPTPDVTPGQAAEARRRARMAKAKSDSEPKPRGALLREEASPVVARFAWPLAVAAAVLWAGGLAAFVAGYERRAWGFDYAPFRLGIAAGMALLPALFILLFAYVARQGARLAAEARKARTLSDELSAPMLLSAAQAGGVAQAVREEIGRVRTTADEALRRMGELRDAMAQESRALTEASQMAERSARVLGGRLQAERAELGGLASTLDAQAQASAEGLARHSRLVAEASDLAQAQMAEAEAALAARAADMLAAAQEAGRAADGAGGELDRQNARLERLAAQLQREREGLAAASEALFNEHDDMLARSESQRARLTSAAAHVRDDVHAVTDAASAGAATLRALMVEASSQLQEMGEAARVEQDSMASHAEAGIDRLKAAAAAARDAAQDSAAALETHALAVTAAARRQVDEIAEAAFAAGQRADQAFEARLAAARRAIDAQAQLVEDAGLRAAERIEAGVAAGRAGLMELETLLVEGEGRMASAPEAARAQVAGLRDAVEQGLEAISAAARRAAADTEAVDAAFQDRIRRTYATLADAIRRMERPPEAAAPPRPNAAREPVQEPIREPARAVANAPAPAPAPPPELPRLRTAALAIPPEPKSEPKPRSELQPEAAPKARPEPRPEPAAESAARPRLRLAPTAEDAEVRALFEAPSLATPAPAAEGWSWKDLLGGVDEVAGGLDDEAVADHLQREIAAMGVDAPALLPRARLDELALTVRAGDPVRLREGVRRLAPAAIRRLARRLLTDKALRTEADLHRTRFATAVARAGEAELPALLATEAGRAWLLLEAAAGDLP